LIFPEPFVVFPMAHPLKVFYAGEVSVSEQTVQQTLVTGAHVSNKMILVVEDDDLTRKFLTAFFRTMGYDVTVAATGEQALTKISGSLPGLVVTDYQLPGMDGVGMVRSLRVSGCRIPSILISGFLSDEVDQEAQEAGFAAIMRKPLELAALQEHVAALLPLQGGHA
jgi:two-component system, OmpR family, response regulator